MLIGFNCEAQLKLTLQQAIDSTLSRNIQIKQARLNILLGKEDVRQSQYNQFPSLSVGPQASVNWGRTLDVSTYNFISQSVSLISGGLSSQVTLFQGGQLRKQIVQNKLLLEADRSNLAKVKNDLTLATATTFLQILTEQDLLIAAHQQVRLADLSVEKVQKGFKAGNKSSADLAQAQAQQANTELDELTLQNQLNNSILNLKQLMDMPDAQLEFTIPDIGTVTKLQSISDTTTLLAQAIAVNPDIRVASLQRDAANQGIKIAQSVLYPSVVLYGSAGSNFSDARLRPTGSQPAGFDTIGFVKGTNQKVLAPVQATTYGSYPFLKQFADNFYQSAGISIQFPIFNHYSARINIRKAKIAYQNAQFNTQLAISNLTTIIKQAFADLAAADKRMMVAQKNYIATKQVLYVSEKRYQAGLLNSLDYNFAVTNFNKAELNLIQSRYDLAFRSKVIDFYLGKPLRFD
ncbi:MAG: transporter [Mucilaginibacter sp.]|nr:transporter [Mucilaginibacter sp.]